MNVPENDLSTANTIGAVFFATARRYPERTFLSDGTRDITFEQADLLVDRICGKLLARGLKRHDRLALLLPNSPEWVLFMLACARIGILVVTVNSRSKAEELAYVLAKSRANALVMVDRYWNIDYCTLLAQTIPGFSLASTGARNEVKLPQLEHVLVFDGSAADFGLDRLLKDAAARPEALGQARAAVQAADPALTVFTSGTTGYPKGAVHSHVFLANARNFAREMHMEDGAVILGHMPFFHVAGLVTAVFPAVLNGCTLITMSQWQPQAAARLIAERRVAFFGGIPTHFIDLAEIVARDRLDTSCLKAAWIGGSTVSPEIARRAKKVLGLKALQAAYGMTETSGCTVLTRFDDPVEMACEGKGVPIGDFEVRVVNPDTGEPRAARVDGEVWVRGHIVMDEYLEDPEETMKVMTGEGWFRTGDLGQFDADGYLKITGRLKDMFIVGGNNVYPAEVERCLDRVPGVRQAVVVGVPDARLGEVGYAFIERDGAAEVSADELLSFAKCYLADYKVPRHIVFVDGFPMTGTRKIQRHALVADARARLEGAQAA
jgi:fatty-acyl-CoA synthase